MLAEWARHPGAAIARAWVLELRDAEVAALGSRVYDNPALFSDVTTRVEVAEMAGRHKGRLEVLNQATLAAKAIEREQAKKGTQSA